MSKHIHVDSKVKLFQNLVVFNYFNYRFEEKTKYVKGKGKTRNKCD